MNEILLRLGEFNEVMDEDDVTKTSSKKRSLAACENQVRLQKIYQGPCSGFQRMGA